VSRKIDPSPILPHVLAGMTQHSQQFDLSNDISSKIFPTAKTYPPGASITFTVSEQQDVWLYSRRTFTGLLFPVLYQKIHNHEQLQSHSIHVAATSIFGELCGSPARDMNQPDKASWCCHIFLQGMADMPYIALMLCMRPIMDAIIVVNMNTTYIVHFFMHPFFEDH
jgi:hypothetical protein